jgi:hypothetical protein
MLANGLKTGERAQWSASFLIGLKTGEVLDLTISVRAGAGEWASQALSEGSEDRAAPITSPRATLSLVTLCHGWDGWNLVLPTARERKVEPGSTFSRKTAVDMVAEGDNRYHRSRHPWGEPGSPLDLPGRSGRSRASVTRDASVTRRDMVAGGVTCRAAACSWSAAR